MKGGKKGRTRRAGVAKRGGDARSLTEKYSDAPKKGVKPKSFGASSSSGDDAITDFPRGLAQPALRALASGGYTRLDQLTRVSERQLAQLHGMGPNALGKLREALSARRLSFAPDPDGKRILKQGAGQ